MVKRRPYNPNSEHGLYQQIARYLQYQYPDVVYRFDLAADLKLTIGQARQHKRLHLKRGYPDLFIAEPSYKDNLTDHYGLFIELKKDGVKLYPGQRSKLRFLAKDGKEYRTQHLQEQADMLLALRQAGYKAEFAIGFEETKQIIDQYLKGQYES